MKLAPPSVLSSQARFAGRMRETRVAVVAETVSPTNQDLVNSWLGFGLDAVCVPAA